MPTGGFAGPQPANPSLGMTMTKTLKLHGQGIMLRYNSLLLNPTMTPRVASQTTQSFNGFDDNLK